MKALSLISFLFCFKIRMGTFFKSAEKSKLRGGGCWLPGQLSKPIQPKVATICAGDGPHL